MDKNLMPIIVSYYTIDTPYEQVAHKHLIPSLEKFELKYDVEAVPHLGSWKQNTDYKATFIFRKLQEYKKPIIWLDADAQVMKYPELFQTLDCDMAVHYYAGWQLASGTMYWNWSHFSQVTTQSWVTWVERYHHQHVEQLCLEMLLKRGVEVQGINMTKLPEEYCYIDSIAVDKSLEPVIYHHQSSREFKSQI